MEFTVDIVPKGKGRPRVCTRGGFTHAYTPKSTLQAEESIRLSYLSSKDRKCLQGAIKVEITAYYKIPTSFTKIKKLEAVNGKLSPVVKPDIDNVAKLVLDSLNGVAFNDDNQVVELFIKKLYSDKPRLLIRIEELENGNISSL